MSLKNFWKKMVEPWKIADDYTEVVTKKDLKDENGIPQMGSNDTNERIIQLDEPVTKLSNLEGIKTLLHELNHQIIDTLFGEYIKSARDMEKIADYASTAQMILMLDNTDKFREILNQIDRRKTWARKKRKKQK